MTPSNSEPSHLLTRIKEAEPNYASHHRVVYEAETLKAVALLATALPYLHDDAYETALDLLDEVGAEARVKKLVGSDTDLVQIGLRELAPVVSRKMGRSLGDFIT